VKKKKGPPELRKKKNSGDQNTETHPRGKSHKQEKKEQPRRASKRIRENKIQKREEKT